MKVSVLLPVYNAGRHLAECLESVLGQDFDDMEILISDNGSTDNSLTIIEAAAAREPRLRWWRNPRNLGMIGNHNACLGEARGDYIKFIHADDKLLTPLAVRKMVSALEANPSAVLAGSRQHITGAETKPVILAEKSGLYDGRHLMITCLEQNTNLIGQPTLTMFRRQAARRGFDDRFTGHLDYAMWFQLLEQGDFIFLAENLATWRIHAEHETARNRASGVKDYEHLRFMETCFAKPWLRQQATPRMLFTQIYYLQKHYGKEAAPLNAAMMSQLTKSSYIWQWLRHKAASPVRKLRKKWRSQTA